MNTYVLNEKNITNVMHAAAGIDSISNLVAIYNNNHELFQFVIKTIYNTNNKNIYAVLAGNNLENEDFLKTIFKMAPCNYEWYIFYVLVHQHINSHGDDFLDNLLNITKNENYRVYLVVLDIKNKL